MNVFHGFAISKFCTIYKEKIIFLLRYQHDSLLMKIFKIACFLFGITFNTTWYNVWCAWVLHSTEIKCAANAVKFLINICFRKTKIYLRFLIGVFFTGGRVLFVLVDKKGNVNVNRKSQKMLKLNKGDTFDGYIWKRKVSAKRHDNTRN